MSESKIPSIITSLYALVDDLETMFPQRRFTLDGHLVGSIGEVVAKYFYNLELLPIGNRNSDAITLEGDRRSVQIKLRGGDAVNLAAYEDHPDLLIVLRIDRKTGFKEVFNGTYPLTLLAKKDISSRRVKTLTVRQLADEQTKIDRSLDDWGRIDELNALFHRGTS